MSDQSGEVLSTKEQLSMKKRESVKLKESAENANAPADSVTYSRNNDGLSH